MNWEHSGEKRTVEVEVRIESVHQNECSRSCAYFLPGEFNKCEGNPGTVKRATPDQECRQVHLYITKE
ncbi:MAG: hypothetical protein KKC03_13215 [Bacteroidetes bacterium]|nr:hypothetical protein [Bacteroidota bacterium]